MMNDESINRPSMCNIDDLLPSRSQRYPPKGDATMRPMKKKEATLSTCDEVRSIDVCSESSAPPVIPIW